MNRAHIREHLYTNSAGFVRNKPGGIQCRPALWLCFCLALLTTACASAHDARQPAHGVANTTIPRSANPPRSAGSIVFFRHKVQVYISGHEQPFSFDGLMRFDQATLTVHVVGVGALGLQFFDLTISQDDFLPAYLHPSLARIPGAGEYIARCVRAVWLESLGTLAPQNSDGHAAPERQYASNVHDGTTLHRIFAKGQRISSRLAGTKTCWTLNAEYDEPQDVWPRLMRFESADGPYTVMIRLVHAHVELEE